MELSSSSSQRSQALCFFTDRFSARNDSSRHSTATHTGNTSHERHATYFSHKKTPLRKTAGEFWGTPVEGKTGVPGRREARLFTAGLLCYLEAEPNLTLEGSAAGLR